MDDFKTICIYENLLVFAYFLKNGRIHLFSLKIQHFQIYFHMPNTFLTLLSYEPCVHVCIFSLYTFYLVPLSRQVSIVMWTILISKSWLWLLKPKRLTSTLHHDKFTYLDYVFSAFFIMYVVHSISFQTFYFSFFIQAFKIVVDSWKFTMLLLYFLWDDWLFFIISGSNQQLQQELEYTLLKPDCHSWWFSKMESDTLEKRYAIKLCFNLGKNATETYGMLQIAFQASCMNRASVFEWHKRFNEGRESVRDDERCGRSKEVNTPQLIGQTVRVRVTMSRF